MPAIINNPTLQIGAKGEKVKELQQLLKQKLPGGAGHHGLAVDGVFGPATQNAVVDFQSFMFLDHDGIVGPKTWKALDAGTPVDMPVLKRGNRGDAVKLLQTVLKELHHYTGTIDSDFGSLTETAVKVFQKRVGLTEDGQMQAETWTKLSQVYTAFVIS